MTLLERNESSPKPEYETGFSSLEEMQNHFVELYGRRNNIYLPGRHPRILLLHRGVADFGDMARKGANIPVLGDMLSRIVSRIFCLAHGVNNVSVAQGMKEKYPFSGCSYCHCNPCQCGERRPDATIGWGSEKSQLSWSLRDWQAHLGKLYGEKNKEKGVGYILNRLGSEGGELISLEQEVTGMGMDEIEKGYRLELADSLAWTIAAANVLGIDLEEAVLNRYGKGCQACQQNPCICGPQSFRQVRI